jgi:copper resistance protein B
MKAFIPRHALALVVLALSPAFSPALAHAQSSQSSQHPHHETPPPTPREDHSQHKTPPPAPAPQEDHSKHKMPAPQPQEERPSFIAPITDEARKAAFPDVQGHTVHDHAINYFVLFDQFEWQNGNDQPDLHWNTKGWIGRDRDRLWFRAEGEREDGDVTDADAELLYGRAISRWWEIVGGVRQEFQPEPSRTWAAVGIQGLAPYFLEIEAAAYIGASGRTEFRFETEYDLLITNRLILEPSIELQAYGKSDPERGLGSGLGTIESGLRLRYEFRRELAPYIGIAWKQKYFGTADFARAAGEHVGSTRLAAGVHFWF